MIYRKIKETIHIYDILLVSLREYETYIDLRISNTRWNSCLGLSKSYITFCKYNLLSFLNFSIVFVFSFNIGSLEIVHTSSICNTDTHEQTHVCSTLSIVNHLFIKYRRLFVLGFEIKDNSFELSIGKIDWKDHEYQHLHSLFAFYISDWINKVILYLKRAFHVE